MPIPDTLLGDLTPDQFLADYWQQQPLLVRGALPDFETFLTPEELAGLACEEDVTSRLLLEHGGDYPWQLRYGPFDPDDFTSLPETHWTLLVQEVDRHVPEATDFLDLFRFLPNWRIDDLQISYAPEHGNAGAHVDSYDVFLFQAYGHRRWQISHAPVPDDASPYVPDLDMQLLQDFAPDDEWVLGPGDLLYLPPRIPHYGVALDDCMTYSVGFRAPTHDELVGGFYAHVLEAADTHARLADPGRTRLPSPGRIDAQTLATVRAVLRSLVADDRALDRWFGRYVTEPRRSAPAFPLDDPYTLGELQDALADGARLRRTAVADFAFVEGPDGPVLFAGGQPYDLAPGMTEAAAFLTGTAPLTAETLGQRLEDDTFAALVLTLVNDGHLLVT